MIIIRQESPNKKEIIELIKRLDAYQEELYPPESNHFLDINSLSAPDVVFITATENERYVGCGSVKLIANEYGEIKRMYVDPQERGKGIGFKILKELEKIASAEGVKFLRLETGIYQPEAIKLYERFGFYKIEPFGKYKTDPLSLFYEKTVTT